MPDSRIAKVVLEEGCMIEESLLPFIKQAFGIKRKSLAQVMVAYCEKRSRVSNSHGIANTDSATSPMEIPYQKLKPEILHAVMVEFVTREGTDYGDRVFTLEEKVAAVRRQLDEGSARVVFDTETESCNIVPVS